MCSNVILELEKLNEEKIEEKSEEKDEMTKKVEEYLANVKRSAHIRPWDFGKAGVQAPGLLLIYQLFTFR